MISDLDGAQLRAHLAARGGRTPVRDRPRAAAASRTGAAGSSPASPPAGPTAFGHLLKPDVAAPGGAILSSTMPAVRRAVRRLRRDEHGRAARGRRGRAAAPAPSGLVAAAGQVRARHRRPGTAWGDTARTVEASVLLAGGGLVNVPRADDPLVFTDPVSLSFGDLNVTRRRAPDAAGSSRRGRGRRRRHVEGRDAAAVGDARRDARGRRRRSPCRRAATRRSASPRAPRQARPPATNYGFLVLRRGETVRADPVPLLRHAARRSGRSTPVPAAALPGRRHARGRSHVSVTATRPRRSARRPTTSARRWTRSGAETLYVMRVNDPVANFGVAVDRSRAPAR